MQDRFKYRAWHKRDKFMFDVVGFNTNTFEIYGTRYKFALENCLLMQCTGLKDKNGKLIYENDIIKFYFDNDEIIAVLIWDNDESRFYLNTTDYFKDKYVTDYEITKQEKYEVIGNIYKNPELIKE